MKIGMMNNPEKDLLEEARFAAENGFDFLDLTIEPPMAQLAMFNKVILRNYLIKHNLGIVGHTNFYLPWASAIKTLRKAAFAELEKQFAVYEYLGASTVSIHAHWYQPHLKQEDIRQNLHEALYELIQCAAHHNITLLLENQPNGPFNTPTSLVPFFQEHKNLQFHLDIGHAHIAGEGKDILHDFLKLFSDRLFHIHISDNKGIHDDHLPLGAGTIDWKSVIHKLKEYKFKDTITLEIFTSDKHYLNYSKILFNNLWNT